MAKSKINRINGCTPMFMDYPERENLKGLASELEDEKDAGALRLIIMMIAHWMRQGERVCFADYAANWLAADRGDHPDYNLAVARLKTEFPLRGERRIADGYSEWGSLTPCGRIAKGFK